MFKGVPPMRNRVVSARSQRMAVGRSLSATGWQNYALLNLPKTSGACYTGGSGCGCGTIFNG